jgi:hypothetical protein
MIPDTDDCEYIINISIAHLLKKEHKQCDMTVRIWNCKGLAHILAS